MSNTNKMVADIVEILLQIRENLLEFETTTMGLLSCGIDEIVEITNKREDIKKRIEELYNKCDKLCVECGIEKALEAAHMRCSREEISEEIYDIYDNALKNRSVVSRIRDTDTQAFERIGAQKDELLLKIKSMNTSNESKAARFASTVDKGDRMYFPGRKTNI